MAHRIETMIHGKKQFEPITLTLQPTPPMQGVKLTLTPTAIVRVLQGLRIPILGAGAIYLLEFGDLKKAEIKDGYAYIDTGNEEFPIAGLPLDKVEILSEIKQ
jgi:hypothetical protein